MPDTITTSNTHYFRIAAAAGVLGGLVVLVNAAKRAGLIPTSAVTQLVAPTAQILGLLLVTGLFVAYGRRAGTLGLVGFLLNFVALAALVGVEFTINLVFAELPAATITELRAGPLGTALLAASVLFLVGTLVFCASLARLRTVPWPALALYAAGSVPVALRATVSEAVLDVSLAAVAIGIVWLGAWLWQNSHQATA